MKWTTTRLLISISFLWVFEPTSATAENESEKKCDKELFLDSTTGKTYNISSPGYPDKSYPPGAPYTWCLSAPDDMGVSILCEEFDIPKSADCVTNALTVSFGKDEKPRAYCGSTTFQSKSSSNKMTVSLHSSKKSRGGRFSCQVQAEKEDAFSPRAIVYENCDCGYSYRMRIVGGQETEINEFPFMAGLIDARRRQAVILCGATIINPRYVLTACHCIEGLELDQTGVVVGEHNVTTEQNVSSRNGDGDSHPLSKPQQLLQILNHVRLEGQVILQMGSETSATKLIKAKRFIPYPYYNSETRQYDLALIELASPITYSARVGPVCLPFTSRNTDLTGELVKVLGWGTTEFGGRRSRVLMKVDLQLIDIQYCINTYGSDIDPYTQLCTYREGADACQSDSGGPLIYFNPAINRHEIVGIVNYGRGCASESPGVNLAVAPFLQYILDTTQNETYCYKTQS